MTREEKLEAIYKEMANKELTPWCCVEIKAQNECGDFTYCLSRWDERPTTEIKEIIWHPVMIGDVLDWIDNKMGVSNHEYEEFVINEVNMAILLWLEYLKPIDEQSDDCVNFIYSLIKK